MADKATRTTKAATVEAGEAVVKDEKPAKAVKAARVERPSAEERSRKAVEARRVLSAARFKALGDPTRLYAVELLRDRFLEASPSGGVPEEESDADGMTVGALSVALGGKAKGSSTLSHHLKELRQAGLISMRRRGKTLICRIEPEALSDLKCVLETNPPRRRAPVVVLATTERENVDPATAGNTRVKSANRNAKTVSRGKNVLTSAAAAAA